MILQLIPCFSRKTTSIQALAVFSRDTNTLYILYIVFNFEERTYLDAFGEGPVLHDVCVDLFEQVG